MDLSEIHFDKDSKEYALNDLSPSKVTKQDGHYEIAYDQPLSESAAKDMNSNVSLVIKDNGEKVMIYQFDDDKSGSHINYAGLSLNSSHGTKIVDYDGKISFISTSINRQNTIDLVNALDKKLGKPTEIINGEMMEELLSPELIDQLIYVFPNDAKKDKDDLDNDIITYPEILIWNKDGLIYQLTLTPLADKITNTLVIISKKALKDKIIMGFHNPEKDPVLSKYL